MSGNLKRAVPRSVVVTGDGAAGLERKLQPPADGARTRRSEGARDDRDEQLPRWLTADPYDCSSYTLLP